MNIDSYLFFFPLHQENVNVLVFSYISLKTNDRIFLPSVQRFQNVIPVAF